MTDNWRTIYKMVEKFNCPVCGEIVEGKKGEHEICGKCRWEDDPYQGRHPDYKGGANWHSLNRARENYRTLGTIMTERDEEEKEKFYLAHTAPDGSWIHDED